MNCKMLTAVQELRFAESSESVDFSHIKSVIVVKQLPSFMSRWKLRDKQGNYYRSYQEPDFMSSPCSRQTDDAQRGVDSPAVRSNERNS